MSTNPPAWNPAASSLGVLLRVVIGVSVLLLGGLMTITFWSLPFGLPLLLLGFVILFSAAVLESEEPGDGAGVGRRNREVLIAQSEARRTMTDAERYLLAGKIVRQRLRRGSTPRAIAEALGTTIVEAMSALQYVESSPGLILRALVEEWPWKKIKHHLQGASPNIGTRSF